MAEIRACKLTNTNIADENPLSPQACPPQSIPRPNRLAKTARMVLFRQLQILGDFKPNEGMF
jgi:hypothetical protein